jgi:hypothetical protein
MRKENNETNRKQHALSQTTSIHTIHLLASLHTSMDLSKTGEGNVLYIQ